MTQPKTDTETDIDAMLARARAAERDERDARTRDQLDQVERLSAAMDAARR